MTPSTPLVTLYCNGKFYIIQLVLLYLYRSVKLRRPYSSVAAFQTKFYNFSREVSTQLLDKILEKVLKQLKACLAQPLKHDVLGGASFLCR